MMLTDIEELFCLEYIRKNLNGVRAYQVLKPHVTYGSAATGSTVMLRNPEVKAKIRFLLEAKKSVFEVEAAVILDNVSNMANASITDLMGDDGEFDLLRIKMAPPEIQRAIESIEVIDDKNGRRVKIKMKDSLRANELLGKYEKLWVDRAEVGGPNGGPIEVRRIVIESVEAVEPEEVSSVDAETEEVSSSGSQAN